MCQAELIGTFQEAGAEERMHLHRGIYYCAGDFVYVQPMGARRLAIAIA
jgi:hypothetical protein